MNNAVLQIMPASLLDQDADMAGTPPRVYCSASTSTTSPYFATTDDTPAFPPSGSLKSLFNSLFGSTGTPRAFHSTAIDAVSITIDSGAAASSYGGLMLPPATVFRGAVVQLDGTLFPLQGASGLDGAPVGATYGGANPAAADLLTTIVPASGSPTALWPSIILADLPSSLYACAVSAGQAGSTFTCAVSSGAATNATLGVSCVFGHVGVMGQSLLATSNPARGGEPTLTLAMASLDVRTTSASTLYPSLGCALKGRVNLLTAGPVVLRCFPAVGASKCTVKWGGYLTIAAGSLFIGTGMQFESVTNGRVGSGGPGTAKFSALGVNMYSAGGSHGGCGVVFSYSSGSDCAPSDPSDTDTSAMPTTYGSAFAPFLSGSSGAISNNAAVYYFGASLKRPLRGSCGSTCSCYPSSCAISCPVMCCCDAVPLAGVGGGALRVIVRDVFTLLGRLEARGGVASPDVPSNASDFPGELELAGGALW